MKFLTINTLVALSRGIVLLLHVARTENNKNKHSISSLGVISVDGAGMRTQNQFTAFQTVSIKLSLIRLGGEIVPRRRRRR